MKFFCVMAEIYKDRYSGTKQAVIERSYTVKPKNQYRQLDGMAAFKIWLTSEADANELCEGIKTGDIGISTLLDAMGVAA